MYQVQIPDAAYTWLLGHVQKIRDKFNKDPNTWVDRLEFVETIRGLHKALLEAEHTVDAKAEKQVAPKKRATRSKPVQLRDGCKEHPTYGAQRPPRTDCSGCWAAYKAYNPLKYATARRKFDRKQTTTE